MLFRSSTTNILEKNLQDDLVNSNTSRELISSSKSNSLSIERVNKMEDIQINSQINRLEESMLRLEKNNYEILDILKNLLISIEKSHKQ